MKFRMELRWTPKGLDHIQAFRERRRKALERAAELGVKGPGGGPIQIHETGSGPDWIVEGSRSDVENLARLFRWHNFVHVTIVGPFLTTDELTGLVNEFARLKDARSR
jgi:hypothetical protein